MAWKNIKQKSLAESMLIIHDALEELDPVNDLINWSKVEKHLSHIHAKKPGEKAWPPIIMFKALLLQAWYDLSDPALEKQLARDLLFRRFVGLDIAESVPDHSSFWRFRKQLQDLKLMDTLLHEINVQISKKGLYVKSGEVSIVDASVIQANRNRPNRNRPNKGKDGQNTQDHEASWNVKAGSAGKRKSTYGFKGHMNVDEDGFVKATGYTAGSVHDSNCFTELLSGEESAVYADSAYQSQAHSKWLAKRNVENRMIKRAYRSKPLTQQDKQFNRQHAGVRCMVERVFGVLKQHYGLARARYLGLARNQTRFELICVAHNIKRGISIQHSCA